VFTNLKGIDMKNLTLNDCSPLQIDKMTLLMLTAVLEKHPVSYSGPCVCGTCHALRK